ncbi:MAG: class I SAM-dependent methyltransferase [Candidatus Cloacimonetes bacterium]|nr:class I SAM-dependent methyltransferase [Candidatus Cloacimonadota bacterium]
MDYHELYETHVELYHDLVSAEDYQENLKKALNELLSDKKKAGLEMGVGTGRVTKLIAPWCDQLVAYDLHQSMLDKIDKSTLLPCLVDLKVANHMSLPQFDRKFDFVVAGWTLCHIIDDHPNNWKGKLDAVLAKIDKNTKAGSKVIIIETLGTGFTNENAPKHLSNYYSYLQERGFSKRVIRTDYCFESIEQAKQLVSFFFGDEMLSKIEKGTLLTLPECTGIWSK